MELLKAIMLFLGMMGHTPVAHVDYNYQDSPDPIELATLELNRKRSEQLSCLRVATYREARDQPIEGQKAVIQVIFRRALEKNKSVCQVVNEKVGGYCQFSYACDAKQRTINVKRLSRYDLKAYKIVDRLSTQEYKKWESGVKPSHASHFKRCDAENSGFSNLKFLFQINNHCFYKA